MNGHCPPFLVHPHPTHSPTERAGWPVRTPGSPPDPFPPEGWSSVFGPREARHAIPQKIKDDSRQRKVTPAFFRPFRLALTSTKIFMREGVREIFFRVRDFFRVDFFLGSPPSKFSSRMTPLWPSRSPQRQPRGKSSEQTIQPSPHAACHPPEEKVRATCLGHGKTHGDTFLRGGRKGQF